MTHFRNGFSLVEVLLALFLLQVALIALAPLFIIASQSTATAGDMGSVGALAVQRMELLREIPFDTLTAGGSLTSNVTGFFDNSDPDFVVRWRVTDNASPATLKTIDVRVFATRAVMGLAKESTVTCVVAE